MYRIAFALIAVLLFAACHSEGIGMDVGKDVSPAESAKLAMEELTVKWLGSVTPEHYVKSVTVDAGRLIEVYIERYSDEVTVEDSCSGSTELSEEDYQTINDHVMAADLLNYEPPVEGEDNCIEQVGGSGVEFTYSVAGGDGVTFSTGTCQLESAIDSITIVVNGVAEKYVTDCTEEIIAAPVEETDETEEVEESEVAEEDEGASAAEATEENETALTRRAYQTYQ